MARKSVRVNKTNLMGAGMALLVVSGIGTIMAGQWEPSSGTAEWGGVITLVGFAAATLVALSLVLIAVASSLEEYTEG